MMAVPSPKSPEQSERSRKYDRQLRLWGDQGQQDLETAHVCLINATALGTEILKSLVLPGIGAFTIIDNEVITEEDVGSNFFLTTDRIGEKRGSIASQLLCELNPDTRGHFIDECLLKLLDLNPGLFNTFTVVVTTSLHEKEIIDLSHKLWAYNIPLLVCQSYGFFGSMRLQFAEHTMIKTHPDNQNPDLRLDCPFPTLKAHFDSYDLDALDLTNHLHVPYLVILYKHLEKWRNDISDVNVLPETYKQKQVIRENIKNSIRKHENGTMHHEENFEEAIRSVNFAYNRTSLPENIRLILKDEKLKNLTSNSQPFWIMIKALKDFVDNEGCGKLPVRGTLPDMTADTFKYISLQQLYHEQAAKDAEAVYNRVQQLLQDINLPDDTITEQDIKIFCKHASELCVMRGTRIADEYERKGNADNEICQSLEDPDSLIEHYIILRGIERFYSEYYTYPGEIDEQVEPDIPKLKLCISKLLNEWGCMSSTKEDSIHEYCRYGKSELHSVSSFIGGCVSHEIIKIITRQYKPVNNSFVFNAINCSTESFTL
ncbi:NEDD8-activating enzyme E1 regulatory subunit [Rhopalosiphum maidis]|uniref:NEDD8-activating enzyme E1 regulatory subunit n=1 Tax=Rhopalosiphum maidis TaxID=43146 RepID=UPI000EFE90AA|nr:NEDD8-activating enzyme E1 regulatory subunit [Rhopalosiphum maidis]